MAGEVMTIDPDVSLIKADNTMSPHLALGQIGPSLWAIAHQPYQAMLRWHYVMSC